MCFTPCTIEQLLDTVEVEQEGHMRKWLNQGDRFPFDNLDYNLPDADQIRPAVKSEAALCGEQI